MPLETHIKTILKLFLEFLSLVKRTNLFDNGHSRAGTQQIDLLNRSLS